MPLIRKKPTSKYWELHRNLPTSTLDKVTEYTHSPLLTTVPQSSQPRPPFGRLQTCSRIHNSPSQPNDQSVFITYTVKDLEVFFSSFISSTLHIFLCSWLHIWKSIRLPVTFVRRRINRVYITMTTICCFDSIRVMAMDSLTSVTAVFFQLIELQLLQDVDTSRNKP